MAELIEMISSTGVSLNYDDVMLDRHLKFQISRDRVIASLLYAVSSLELQRVMCLNHFAVLAFVSGMLCHILDYTQCITISGDDHLHWKMNKISVQRGSPEYRNE